MSEYIFLVGDHDDPVKRLEDAFKEEGFLVHSCTDVNEALATIDGGFEYGLLFCDQTEEGSRDDVIKKSKETHSRIPVFSVGPTENGPLHADVHVEKPQTATDLTDFLYSYVLPQ